MKRKKHATIQATRRETSNRQVYGERHNVESGNKQVKTTSAKIPKMPAEKIDIDLAE